MQLQQVLMNLMLNGIEAMEDGGGELTIRSQRIENGLVLDLGQRHGCGSSHRKTGSDLQRILYNQASRYRYGAGNQSFDH